MADGDKFPDDHSGETGEVVQRRSVGDDPQYAFGLRADLEEGAGESLQRQKCNSKTHPENRGWGTLRLTLLLDGFGTLLRHASLVTYDGIAQRSHTFNGNFHDISWH